MREQPLCFSARWWAAVRTLPSHATVPVGGGRGLLAFGIGCMNERGIDLLAWVMGIIAAVLALYFLTAPPIMTAIVKQSGTMSFPAIYQPIMRLIESDFNG